MIDGGGYKNSRGNMLLGVAVAILSIVGLGTNVYKHNTGENVEWFSIVSELAMFAAALYFVISYFRNRKDKKDEKEIILTKKIALIEKDEEGGYVIHSSDTESTIIGEGETIAEAKADFEKALREAIDAYKEDGEDVPAELQNVEFEYKEK
ncbi:MAG: type II toxin-antitoxin system HicB family antitoxin [Alistipes sp.]|nr:type II toxin-antitoxin system HicB family antitoxin [Alistipes sp.]